MTNLECAIYQKCKDLEGIDSCTALLITLVVTLVILLLVILIPKIYQVWYSMICNYANDMFALYVMESKQELFSDMSELTESLKTNSLTILEIGAGSGTNFQFFPSGSSVIALEPNQLSLKYLKKNASSFPGIDVKLIVSDLAEHMTHIADSSVCAVVSTIVLSSVQDVDAVLCEVKRVLRSGGRFYFLEHVYCEEKCFTQQMQRLLNHIQVRLWKNCHLTRTLSDNIDSAGFSEVQYRKFWARKVPSLFFVMKAQLLGTATK